MLRFDLPDDPRALEPVAHTIAARIGSSAVVGTPMVGSLGGSPISMRLHYRYAHVQAGRSRCRIEIALELPLRGFVAALRTHREVATGFPTVPLSHPIAARRRLDAAPREVGARVFDAHVLGILHAIDQASPLGLESFTIGQGAVRMVNDAPADGPTLDAIFELFTRLRASIGAITGDLSNHPDVIQAARAESRGRALAIVIMIVVFAVVLGVIYVIAFR
jgi:hypothetical protein